MSNQKTLQEEFEEVLGTDTMVYIRNQWAPGARRASWFVRLPSGREYCLPTEPKLVGTPEIGRYVASQEGWYREWWRAMCIARVRGDLVIGSPGAIAAYRAGKVQAYYYRRRDYEDSHHD